MDPENIHDRHFEEYFSQLIKDRGVNIKKLSEATGIAPKHLQALSTGDFSHLPSTPYVRGYLVKLGEVLHFDPEPWWTKLKMSGFLQDSGAEVPQSKSRLAGWKHFPRLAWGALIAIIAIIYLAFQFGRIFGTPKISIAFPSTNPAHADTSTMNLVGSLANGTELYVNGELVPVNADGNWNKAILLNPGMNTAVITAKKFLGGEAKITEEILYEPATANASSAVQTP